MKNRLTDKGIRSALAARNRTRLSDGGIYGAGVLRLDVWATGSATWVYREPAPERAEYVMGPYDVAGRTGLTLVQARKEADKLEALMGAGVRGLAAHFAAERAAEKVAEIAAREV